MKLVELSIVILASLASLVVAEEDEESTIYDRIFSEENIQTDNITQLFERLAEIYANAPKESTDARRKRAKSILKISKLDENNCDKKYFKPLETYIPRKADSPNIRKYLKNQRVRQKQICKDKFKNEFDNAIEGISAEMRLKLEAFGAALDKSNEEFSREVDTNSKLMSMCSIEVRMDSLKPKQKEKDKFYKGLTYETMAAGVLDYLVIHESKQIELSTNKWSGIHLTLLHMVEDYIEPMCKAVSATLRPFEYIFTSKDSTFFEIDELKRYFKYRMYCHCVLFNVEYLVSELVRQFK